MRIEDIRKSSAGLFQLIIVSMALSGCASNSHMNQSLKVCAHRICPTSNVSIDDGQIVRSVSLNIATVSNYAFDEDSQPLLKYSLEARKISSTSERVASFVAELQECEEIEHLDLVGLPLRESDMDFHAFQNLEYLDVSFCDINSRTFNSLMHSDNIVTLRLAGNGGIKDDLREVLTSLPHLKSLQLDGIRLSEREFSEILENCRSLRTVYIRGCGLNGQYEKPGVVILNKWSRVSGAL